MSLKHNACSNRIRELLKDADQSGYILTTKEGDLLTFDVVYCFHTEDDAKQEEHEIIYKITNDMKANGLLPNRGLSLSVRYSNLFSATNPILLYL